MVGWYWILAGFPHLMGPKFPSWWMKRPLNATAPWSLPQGRAWPGLSFLDRLGLSAVTLSEAKTYKLKQVRNFTSRLRGPHQFWDSISGQLSISKSRVIVVKRTAVRKVPRFLLCSG